MSTETSTLGEARSASTVELECSEPAENMMTQEVSPVPTNDVVETSPVNQSPKPITIEPKVEHKYEEIRDAKHDEINATVGEFEAEDTRSPQNSAALKPEYTRIVKFVNLMLLLFAVIYSLFGSPEQHTEVLDQKETEIRDSFTANPTSRIPVPSEANQSGPPAENKDEPVVMGKQMNACATEEHTKGPMPSDSETKEAKTTPPLDLNAITILSSSDHLSIDGCTSGQPISFLVDTGANVTAIKAAVWRDLPPPTKHPPKPLPVNMIRSVSGQEIPVLGQVEIPFEIQSEVYPHTALVIENIAYDAILGKDFLERYRATIDLAAHSLELNNEPVPVPTTTPAVDKHRATCFVRALHNDTLPPKSEQPIVPTVLKDEYARTTRIAEPHRLVPTSHRTSPWTQSEMDWLFRKHTREKLAMYDPSYIAHSSTVFST